MKKGCFVATDLVCLECGNVFTISRRENRLKSSGHIKDLWCPKCKNITKHYEVRDVSKFKWDSESDDEIKQYVKDLLINGPEDNDERKDRIFKKILKR